MPAHVQDGAAATSAHGSARLGADEFYKITMTVHNRSDMTLDVTSAQLAYDNGKNGGNWTSRPVSQLVPGQSETVEAYSAAGGQGISLVYRAVENRAEVKMVAQDPTAGANNTKDTVAAAPLIVTPSISKGLNCSATFTVTGNW